MAAARGDGKSPTQHNQHWESFAVQQTTEAARKSDVFVNIKKKVHIACVMPDFDNFVPATNVKMFRNLLEIYSQTRVTIINKV